MDARQERVAVAKEHSQMPNKWWSRWFVVVLLLAACQHFDSFDDMAKAMCIGRAKDITLDEAPKNAQWIDVRTDAEYRVSHLNGAQHCAWDGKTLHGMDSLFFNQPIVVYCSVGYRSEKAAEYLMENGFLEVYNLYGGIFKVVNERSVADSLGKPIERIHGFNSSWAKWITTGEIVYE